MFAGLPKYTIPEEWGRRWYLVNPPTAQEADTQQLNLSIECAQVSVADRILTSVVRPVLDALHTMTFSRLVCFTASLWGDAVPGVAKALIDYCLSQSPVSHVINTATSPSPEPTQSSNGDGVQETTLENTVGVFTWQPVQDDTVLGNDRHIEVGQYCFVVTDLYTIDGTSRSFPIAWRVFTRLPDSGHALVCSQELRLPIQVIQTLGGDLIGRFEMGDYTIHHCFQLNDVTSDVISTAESSSLAPVQHADVADSHEMTLQNAASVFKWRRVEDNDVFCADIATNQYRLVATRLYTTTDERSLPVAWRLLTRFQDPELSGTGLYCSQEFCLSMAELEQMGSDCWGFSLDCLEPTGDGNTLETALRFRWPAAFATRLRV